jgi:hypothetical protein
MAITGLNLPIDIPWERVCVSTEMLDPDIGGAGLTPPLWQTSMALFRYVPPDEYQIYPDRRIVYYKLTCTITGYTPQAQEILGAVDPGHLGLTNVPGVTELLNSFLPCNGAIVQLTVVPKEKGRKPGDYPYFMEMQPRQRLLYEQASDTRERTSRNLGGLQVRKDAATSNSLEVMDVDAGGSANFQAFGVGGGGSQSGQWGTKTLGKIDSGQTTTADASREARETLSFTTQLTQMYTTLQSYQLGTNRVFFFLTPRPHVLEVPSGFIQGPRHIDGIQDFFLVVNQAKGDKLPCLEIRLDTSHLTMTDDTEYDFSQPTKRVIVDLTVPLPAQTDPTATKTSEGSSVFYDCLLLSKTSPAIEVDAPLGYVIHEVKEVFDPLSNLPLPGIRLGTIPTPQPTADRKKVAFTASASSHICYRNGAGDAANHVITGIGYYINPDFPWPKHHFAEIGRVSRTFDVSFRSELKSKKVGEHLVLLLTTRLLRCCDDVKSEPAKIVEIIELPVVIPYTPPATTGSTSGGELTDLPVMLTAVPYTPTGTGGTQPTVPFTPTGTGGTAPTTVPPSAPPPVPATSATSSGMSVRQANEIGQLVASETRRASLGIRDPRERPALDAQYLMNAMVRSAAGDPRRSRTLARPADSLLLKDEQMEMIALALGRPGAPLTSFDVAVAPEGVLEVATGRKGTALLKLRLEALGLRPPAGAKLPATKGAGTRYASGDARQGGSGKPGRSRRPQSRRE